MSWEIDDLREYVGRSEGAASAGTPPETPTAARVEQIKARQYNCALTNLDAEQEQLIDADVPWLIEQLHGAQAKPSTVPSPEPAALASPLSREELDALVGEVGQRTQVAGRLALLLGEYDRLVLTARSGIDALAVLREIKRNGDLGACALIDRAMQSSGLSTYPINDTSENKQ